MEITEVKVFPVNEEKLKAFVSIVFDRCFMINDIKIIQGRDGLFVSMPSRRKKSGEFKDVAHPLNNETRRMIEMAIVGEYERVLAERGEELPAPPRSYPSDGDEEPAGEKPAAAAGSPPPVAYGVPPQAAVPGTAVAAAGAAPAAASRAVDGTAPAGGPIASGQDGSGQDGNGQDGIGQDGAGEESDGRAGAKQDETPPMAAGGEGPDKSLEEVQEIHLRDSFWSVS